VHPQIRCQAAVADGASVGRGEAVFRAQGCARAILAAERTALNFLARLSGIATLTRKFVSEIEGTPARIRDTRKTTPLHRILEKYAVRLGGGTNHRFGLHDAMLIKENHIAVAGSVAEAVRRALLLASAPPPSFPETTAYESFQAPAGTIEVQVEVRNEAELREALAAGAPAVLLDNQSPADAARLVQLTRSINPRCLVEVSGGVSLQNVRAYAESGADFIAIGALTHSAPAADFSLLIEH
jgi:nicotinate-nucleotide pyrophosphorylase (carboxylating)